MRRVFSLLVCILFIPSFSVCTKAADAYAYPEPEVLQIDLVMQPYRYLKMIGSKEKQKYDAVVCINEGEPQKIGVQVRGATSLNAGMKMASKRIPLELCFDYADPSASFRGNPSLKLINCLTPARLMTQLIAMETFAFLGVPTPRISPAFIRINDTDFGLYLAVEDINEAFAQNHFNGASLYRPFSSKTDVWNDPMPLFDSSAMTTKVDSGGKTFERYIQAKESGLRLDSLLDVDEILRFMACETFVMDDDGFLKSCHNFYLADDHGKLKLLPWDKDDVFRAFTDIEKFQGFDQYVSPLFQYLMQDEAYSARYRKYIRQLNDTFLNPDTFLPWVEEYIRSLSPFFQRDKTIRMQSNDVLADLTTGNELYNMNNGNLLLTFKVYHEQLDAILSGKTESFSIPKGMTLAQKDSDSPRDSFFKGISVPFRVCAGYWRLQRQAIWQGDGKSPLLIGCLFTAVFVCAVLAVLRPARRRRGHGKADRTH